MKWWLSLTMLFLIKVCVGQNDSLSSKPENQKIKHFTYLSAGLYASTITGLYFLWYDGYPQSGFHFINDNAEWLQMDKIGHATSAYQVGYYCFDAFTWGGMPEKKAVWIGGLMGFAYLATVEIFDGFSAEWGASSGDIVANTAGAGLFIGQQLLWKEQRISLKFSVHPSPYRKYRPDLLGGNQLQGLLKDYNGQTYWLSTNIASFLQKDTRFPAWLDVAIGYSADGMTGAHTNADNYLGNPIPTFERKRQFFLSPDINLRKIPTKNKTLKFVFTALSLFKFPLPTLAINDKNQVQFYWFYF